MVQPMPKPMKPRRWLHDSPVFGLLRKSQSMSWWRWTKSKFKRNVPYLFFFFPHGDQIMRTSGCMALCIAGHHKNVPRTIIHLECTFDRFWQSYHIDVCCFHMCFACNFSNYWSKTYQNHRPAATNPASTLQSCSAAQLLKSRTLSAAQEVNLSRTQATAQNGDIKTSRIWRDHMFDWFPGSSWTWKLFEHVWTLVMASSLSSWFWVMAADHDLGPFGTRQSWRISPSKSRGTSHDDSSIPENAALHVAI